jgi:hypothetical protein
MRDKNIYSPRDEKREGCFVGWVAPTLLAVVASRNAYATVRIIALPEMH